MADDTPERSMSLQEDALVAELLPIPGDAPPDVRAFVGFLGRSTREGHWRLYVSARLDEYLEIAADDIVRTISLGRDQFPLGGTMLWVRRSAKVLHSRSKRLDLELDYLSGDIVSSLEGNVGSVQGFDGFFQQSRARESTSGGGWLCTSGGNCTLEKYNCTHFFGPNKEFHVTRHRKC